jgi:hypothetical protein
MARDEQDLPIIPHEIATGADCCGCLIVQVAPSVMGLSFSPSCVTIHVTKIAAWRRPAEVRIEVLGKNYSAAPTDSPAAHSACPHSQVADG